MYRIAVMEGDGIGPEIVRGAVRVLKAIERISNTSMFDLVPLAVGLEAYERFGSTLPEETKKDLRRCDGAILGPVTTHLYQPDHKNMPNPSAVIRKSFDLYANLRPVRSVPGLSNKFPNVDMLIVRENTEGMYADRNLYYGSGEWMTDADTVLSMRVVTRRGSERIARIAFEMAVGRNRKKHVAVVHKANVLRKGCGLFLDTCRQVHASYPDVNMNDYLVDAFAMHLILEPEQFDVIVTTNMFGDILSDEAAGLVGGLGLAPGLNVGADFAMAQAAHGSAPTIAGKNVANPVAELLSVQMLLEWLAGRRGNEKLKVASHMIEQAVWTVLEEGRALTPDLGGRASTDSMINAIIAQLNKVKH